MNTEKGRYYYEKDENNQDILTDASGQYQAMMEWEKSYMEAIIEKLNPSGDVLEIGFGLGYSADAIQKFDINSHTIIEADENVLKKLKEWAPLQKHKVNIIEGCWQYRLPSMTQKFDSFFFDDYPVDNYPDPNNSRFLDFVDVIIEKNVNKNARLTSFSGTKFRDELFTVIEPCHMVIRTESEIYNLPISENEDYLIPKYWLGENLYLSLITFQTGSPIGQYK